MINPEDTDMLVLFVKETTGTRRLMHVVRVIEIKMIYARKLFIVETVYGTRSFYEDRIIDVVHSYPTSSPIALQSYYVTL